MRTGPEPDITPQRRCGALWAWLMKPAFGARRSDAPSRRRSNAQRGVALIVVTAGLTIIGAMQLTLRKRAASDIASAENFRDDLRAHYLARSGMNLSRLVIKVQQSVLDKFRKQIGDIQLAEFVPTLIRAFAGGQDEVAGLASLVGNVDTSKIKGLGLPGGRSKQDFTLEMDTDDGRINVNCAGGTGAQQVALQGKLAGLFLSPEYDNLFMDEDPDGQLTDRVTLVNAIIDYIDPDDSMYGGSGANEEYGYGKLTDKYLPKNNYIDSVEELQLVRGVGDQMMDKFRSFFTVYGGCKVNLAALGPNTAPMIAMLIIQGAKNPDDPVLKDTTRFITLIHAVAQVRGLWGVPFTIQSFMDAVKDPTTALSQPGGGLLSSFLGGGPTTPTPGAQVLQIDGVELDQAKLGQLVVDGPRRTYRVEATASVGRVSKRIFAIFDSQHINQNNIDPAYRTGTWVYWRED